MKHIKQKDLINALAILGFTDMVKESAIQKLSTECAGHIAMAPNESERNEVLKELLDGCENAIRELQSTASNFKAEIYGDYSDGHGGVKVAGRHLTEICHGIAVKSGWWTDLKTGESLVGKRNVGEMLCLVHSEISEAMEGHRKNLMDDKLPHRKMVEVELADAVIRIMDLAGGLGLDVGAAMAEKLEYNQSRQDHKLENRVKEGGKQY